MDPVFDAVALATVLPGVMAQVLPAVLLLAWFWPSIAQPCAQAGLQARLAREMNRAKPMARRRPSEVLAALGGDPFGFSTQRSAAG
jgi:hypothetical protein